MPNIENSPKNYKPESGSVYSRVSQGERGSLRLPHIGKETPQGLAERYPEIKFVNPKAVRISGLLESGDLDNSQAEALVKTNRDLIVETIDPEGREFADKMSEDRLAKIFKERVEINIGEFKASLNSHLENKYGEDAANERDAARELVESLGSEGPMLIDLPVHQARLSRAMEALTQLRSEKYAPSTVDIKKISKKTRGIVARPGFVSKGILAGVTGFVALGSSVGFNASSENKTQNTPDEGTTHSRVSDASLDNNLDGNKYVMTIDQVQGLVFGSSAAGTDQIESPKVSGDLAQETAFEAMDKADGEDNDELTFVVRQNETFKDALARTLGKVGIEDEKDLDSYSNFIQYQLDQDLSKLGPGQPVKINSDDLHGNAFVWRTTDEALTQELLNKYANISVDRTIDENYFSDEEIEGSKKLAEDIKEFVSKLGQGTVSGSGANRPDASGTAQVLPVAGGYHNETPEHDATRPVTTRTAAPRTSTAVPPTYEAETATATATEEPEVCIPIDLRGRLDYTGDHISENPVIAHLENHAENTSCDDTVYVHIFGSMQEPETQSDWLESQSYVSSQEIDVPEGAGDYTTEIEVPNDKYCWYQVDLVRTDEVRVPPYYNDSDQAMIDYVFVKDTDSCLPATSTSSPTSTYTSTATPPATETSTPSPDDTPTEVPTDTPTATETVVVPTETPIIPTETPTVLVPQLPETGSYEPQSYRVPGAAVPMAVGVGAAAIAAGWYGVNRRRDSEDESETVTSKIAES